MKLWLTFILLMIIPFEIISAQDSKLVIDKPGSFIIVKQGIYGNSHDIYNYKYVYTKTESKANYEKLVGMIDVFRKTPVLAEQKGYDGEVSLKGSTLNSKCGFGIPCMVVFMFKEWFLRKGKLVQWTVEPPQWRFQVNELDRFASNGFNYTSTVTNPPTNPAYDEQKRINATIALRELFFQPGKKESVGQGIDKYGNEQVVIFNPHRPPYWIQVTIREVFNLYFNYWKMEPDKRDLDKMLEVLNTEYARFTELERDGYAYMGNNESIFLIGTDSRKLPVLLPNPDYWNKDLTRSAIQFIVLSVPGDKDFHKKEMENLLKRNDGYYYVKRLLYELDINTLYPIIDQ